MVISEQLEDSDQANSHRVCYIVGQEGMTMMKQTIHHVTVPVTHLQKQNTQTVQEKQLMQIECEHVHRPFLFLLAAPSRRTTNKVKNSIIIKHTQCKIYLKFNNYKSVVAFASMNG